MAKYQPCLSDLHTLPIVLIKRESKANKNSRDYREFLMSYWLGWQDLNLRVRESKTRALPLGDTPVTGFCKKWGEIWDSNP